MPDPFRHYEGVPVVDLPADAPANPADGAAFLARLLFHSAAISATKIAPVSGHRYALRVNPSSGNLHPTEFHFVTRGLAGWEDGVYHYRPSSHMAEQRGRGVPDGFAAPLTFVLTSIAWREAWKYRDRAYRYCLLDIGHAWQALELAARDLGCEASAFGGFDDDALSAALGLADDEWPMLVVEIRGAGLPLSDGGRQSAFEFVGGVANRLSESVVPYPAIDSVHRATKSWRTESGWHPLARPRDPDSISGAVARRRRSALDFEGGERGISLRQFAALVAHEAAFLDLYVYAHRVEGVAAGVYRVRSGSPEVELIRPGDQQVMAAALSLGQNLAGNACLAFSMVADLERATREFGDRGYRYALFEAGALGHRLYLAATAMGLGATGIGAFYDDDVHRYLGLRPGDGQVAYHFAVGYPVVDGRLEG